MNLPFGLKQKPLRHYFQGGSLSFTCKEGVMFATLTITNRKSNHIIDSDGSKLTMIGFDKWKYNTIKVQNKEHLDKLLSIKSLHEIPTIEEVVN